ncbi:hypothetical protein D3C87_2198140 [compost metagenome]
MKNRRHGVGFLATMAQRIANTGRQFANPKGFFDIVIGTEIKRCDFFIFAVAGRQDDDRNV